jgi:hypothetical protein
MPIPPVPDSRRFAKHLTGIIHSELLEIPGVVSQEMRLVRHDPLTDAGPTTCAEIDVASVSGSRARIVVYPLPPADAGLSDEELEHQRISPEIDVESLDLYRQIIDRNLAAAGWRGGKGRRKSSLATGRDSGQPVDSRDHLLGVRQVRQY